MNQGSYLTKERKGWHELATGLLEKVSCRKEEQQHLKIMANLEA